MNRRGFFASLCAVAAAAWGAGKAKAAGYRIGKGYRYKVTSNVPVPPETMWKVYEALGERGLVRRIPAGWEIIQAPEFRNAPPPT